MVLVFIFGRVPRYARVGVLRASLSLRCFALGCAHPPHASRGPHAIPPIHYRQNSC